MEFIPTGTRVAKERFGNVFVEAKASEAICVAFFSYLSLETGIPEWVPLAELDFSDGMVPEIGVEPQPSIEERQTLLKSSVMAIIPDMQRVAKKLEWVRIQLDLKDTDEDVLERMTERLLESGFDAAEINWDDDDKWFVDIKRPRAHGLMLLLGKDENVTDVVELDMLHLVDHAG